MTTSINAYIFIHTCILTHSPFHFSHHYYYLIQFYVSNPLNVLSIRHWHTHNYCVWDPAKHKDYASKDPLTASLTSSLTATEDMTASQVEKVVAEAEYPDFGENDDLDLKLRIP